RPIVGSHCLRSDRATKKPQGAEPGGFWFQPAWPAEVRRSVAAAATAATAVTAATATVGAAETTVAATTAAETTAAATATAGATEATSAGRTGFHWAGFVDHQAAAAKRLTVHAFNGGQGFCIAAHLDKTEAFGAAGVAFHHDLGAVHNAISAERLLQVFVAHGVGQVAHVQFVAHDWDS